MNLDNFSLKKINNGHYASDINYATKHTKWFLMILGIWPCIIESPTRIQRFISKIFIPFIPSFILIVLVIPLIIFTVIRETERSEFVMFLGPLSFRLANILKNFILVYRRRTIKLCMRHMEIDWQMIENTREREIMLKNLRVGHFLTYICTASLYGGAIFYQIMPLFTDETSNEFNVTVKPSKYPETDIFIDTQIGYNLEIVFCGNCIAAFYLFVIITAICNLAAILVTHACGQIQIIVSRLESLVDINGNYEKSDLDYRISSIIRCHVRVLRFSSRVDEGLREICLVEVVSSTLVICLLEYYCMTEWKNSSTMAIITYVLLLISSCFNIFIFCHIGELLKEQCQTIGKATYMMEWYRLPNRAGLALIMVIAMANYPRKLTAGRMMELSLYSFGNIIKTSVAYLNMLQAVAE